MSPRKKKIAHADTLLGPAPERSTAIHSRLLHGMRGVGNLRAAELAQARGRALAQRECTRFTGRGSQVQPLEPWRGTARKDSMASQNTA